MRLACEERCILELTRSIRNKTLVSQDQALAEAREQYQNIIDQIESKKDYAHSVDRDYFYISADTPDCVFKMLKIMGYKMSQPPEARLNFDNETVKVSF